MASEARLEIGDAPQNLRFLIAGIGQRQNHMVEGLGDRVAVAGIFLAAFAVGGEDGAVDFRIVAFKPTHQGRADVEADHRVIVDDPHDAVLRVEDARDRIRAVTLGGDALIPIVERISGILQFDFFEPGIFARRLIEMTVDANVLHHV